MEALPIKQLLSINSDFSQMSDMNATNMKVTLRKVPEIIILFWVIKLLTTAMGEATSDYLVHALNPYVAVALGALGFTLAICMQFLVKKYIAWVYWLTVVMVAIFGTMAADVLHVGFGIPYAISSIFFALCLSIVFILWYRVEKTLSIHSIYTFRRELFYWVTIVITFALGTAVGDLTAATLGLGYLLSGFLFAGLFALPAIGYRFFKFNAVVMFWIAYILTRPFGASFADWFGRSHSLGGLGLGSEKIAGILTILIFIAVWYLAITKKDIKG